MITNEHGCYRGNIRLMNNFLKTVYIGTATKVEHLWMILLISGSGSSFGGIVFQYQHFILTEVIEEWVFFVTEDYLWYYMCYVITPDGWHACLSLLTKLYTIISRLLIFPFFKYHKRLYVNTEHGTIPFRFEKVCILHDKNNDFIMRHFKDDTKIWDVDFSTKFGLIHILKMNTNVWLWFASDLNLFENVKSNRVGYVFYPNSSYQQTKNRQKSYQFRYLNQSVKAEVHNGIWNWLVVYFGIIATKVRHLLL